MLSQSKPSMEQGGAHDYDGPPPHYNNVERSSGTISPRTAAPVAAGPAPFLLKTYEMVDDATTDAAVSWSSTGTSFVVWDPQYFCQHLLPLYFKHSNFSSFIRQLNVYGFRKSDPDRWEFANRGFVRGQRHLLQGIRRRRSAVAAGRPQQTAAPSSSSSHHFFQEGRALHANVVHQCDAVAQRSTQMQNQLALASDRPGSDVLTMDAHRTSRGHSEQGLQEEIERLKREKSLLTMEVMRLRQQSQKTEQDVQTMWQRVQIAEQGQHHMLALAMQAANKHNQAVLANIMGQEPHQIRRLSQHQIPWQQSVHGADQDHPPQLEYSAQYTFSTLDVHHGAVDHEGGLSGFNTSPQPQFPSHSTRLESGPWLKDGPQVPKLQLDRPHAPKSAHCIIRQEPSFTIEHEFSYQIITKEVTIRASFLQKNHAEAE